MQAYGQGGMKREFFVIIVVLEEKVLFSATRFPIQGKVCYSKESPANSSCLSKAMRSPLTFGR